MTLMIDRRQYVRALGRGHARGDQNLAAHGLRVVYNRLQKPPIFFNNGSLVLFPDVAEVAQPDAEQVTIIALERRTHQLEEPVASERCGAVTPRAPPVDRLPALCRDIAGLLQSAQ